MRQLGFRTLSILCLAVAVPLASRAQTPSPAAPESRAARPAAAQDDQVRITGPASGPAPVEGPLPSGGARVISTINAETVARLMKGVGFSALEIDPDSDGTQVRAAIDGTDTFIRLENCEKGSCVTLMFLANFGKQDAIDAAWINSYNANTIYTKMFLNGDGEAILSIASSLYKGVTEEHVASLGELWVVIFKEALAYEPKR